MRIEPHARDPDDDPSDRDDHDHLPGGDENLPLDERLTEHSAAFLPPCGDHQPRPASYLHGLRLRKLGADPQEELKVLERVRTVVNDKGDEVLASTFLAEVFGDCHTIRNLGLFLASGVARQARARNKDEQREIANDLFQECVYRWMAGNWNYSLEHFKTDLATNDPLLSMGFRLFGRNGRIRSLLDSELKRARTRSQLESAFFGTHQADLTPSGGLSRGASHGPDGTDVLEVKAPDPVNIDDVLRLLQTPQTKQRLQTLVEIAASRGGFDKHSAAAPEVFRLLHAKPRIDRKLIAERCGVPLSFVNRMGQSKHDGETMPYVVAQIRKHAADTPAYDELMGLCPQELLERFRHHQMQWLAEHLSEYQSAWAVAPVDTPDDEAFGD